MKKCHRIKVKALSFLSNVKVYDIAPTISIEGWGLDPAYSTE